MVVPNVLPGGIFFSMKTCASGTTRWHALQARCVERRGHIVRLPGY